MKLINRMYSSSSSSKDKRIKVIQANIRRKLLSGKTSLLKKEVFLPDVLKSDKYSSASKVQNYLKSVFFTNRFTLETRIYYYVYINKKISSINSDECLKEKDFSGTPGFTIKDIIDLEKKIGTDSFNGSIYKTSIKNVLGAFPLATKLMEHDEANNTEVSVMNDITQNIIIQKKSKHFFN